MVEVFEEHQASVLGVQTVPHDQVSKYGIVDGKKLSDRLYTVSGLVEKPPVDKAPTDVAILGRYIIEPEIFDYLEKTKPGAGGEIQLTDALMSLAKDKKMLAYDFVGRRYDVGDKLGFLTTTVEYDLRRDDLKDKFMDYLKEIIK